MDQVHLKAPAEAENQPSTGAKKLYGDLHAYEKLLNDKLQIKVLGFDLHIGHEGL